MKRPLPLLCFLPLFLFLFSSCGSAQVLGLPPREAALLLEKGDTRFIFNAELPAGFAPALSRLKELRRIHPAAPFYAALLAEELSLSPDAEPDAPPGEQSRSGGELAFLLFSAALEGPSPSASREAARKLVPLILETREDSPENGEPPRARELLDSGVFAGAGNGEQGDGWLLALKAACLYRLGRYRETAEFLSADSPEGWRRALALFAAYRDASSAGGRANARAAALGEEIAAFLFTPLPEDLKRWANREALSFEGLLGPGETAALSGKLVPEAGSAGGEELRAALADGGTIFFRYPELIADLGRAFLYTPGTREEGAEIFSFWETLLTEPDASALPGADGTDGFGALRMSIKTLGPEEIQKRRYLVLFYLGRIERAGEEYARSTEHFRRAQPLAPDSLQSDACIWYMLMNALAEDPSTVVPLALGTMPLWKDMSYFEDILDRAASYFSARRRWNAIQEIFAGLEKRAPGGSLAQYAWILGRAAEEGWLETDRSPESFFRAAFHKEGSLYYRAMAASRLGARFVPEASAPAENAGMKGGPPEGGAAEGGDLPAEKEKKEELRFLLGFFECGAASFVSPYLRAREAGLSAPELRKIAEALASAARWKECLDLVSRYTGRKGRRANREDLRLFYPRPFRELIERSAREAHLDAEVLYGLIRTESYFQSRVVSRSGAVGLAQLMAPTAADMAGRIARQGGPDYRGPDGIDLADPEINVRIGAYYLGYLAELMESPMLALLAYNGGMGRVRRWLAADKAKGGLPPDLFLETVELAETREYGRRVLAAAAVYGYLYYGASMEDTAAGIYRGKAGGGDGAEIPSR